MHNIYFLSFHKKQNYFDLILLDIVSCLNFASRNDTCFALRRIVEEIRHVAQIHVKVVK